jgi:DNA-binding CsgD family transcriptional regulator
VGVNEPTMLMPSSLSPRERQVLDEKVKGFTNKETAAHLGITEQTVKNYIGSMLFKTGALNIVELVARYVRWTEFDKISPAMGLPTAYERETLIELDRRITELEQFVAGVKRLMGGGNEHPR